MAARIAIPAPICTTKSSAKFGLRLVTATLYGPDQGSDAFRKNTLYFCLLSNQGVGLGFCYFLLSHEDETLEDRDQSNAARALQQWIEAPGVSASAAHFRNP